MQTSFAEQVYSTLNGEYVPGHGISGVDNAFAEGAICTKWYADAYDAYQRLCDRLGVIDEDPDVEIIFRSFMEIGRTMGIQMFYYGQLFYRQTPTPTLEKQKKEELVEME